MRRKVILAAAVATLLAHSPMIAGQAKAEEITVVSVHSQTGPVAFLGVGAANGIKIAVEQLNAAKFLGNDTLKLLVFDDATTTSQTQVMINRAALQEKALVVFGPSDSVRSAAVGPLVNELKIPTITTGFTEVPLANGPWMFKVTTNSAGQVMPLAEYAAEKLKPKRFAAVYLRDNEAQISPMRMITDYLAGKGTEIVAREGIAVTENDFAAIATKIAGMKPDAVYLGTNADQAANIVIQLKQAGVDKNIPILGLGGFGPDYIRAGGAAIDNSYAVADFNPQNGRRDTNDFVDLYQKRFGVLPDNWAAVGHASMVVAAHAIRNAGPNPTRERVREELMKLKDVPVVIGGGKWTETPSRVPNYGMQIVQIMGGKVSPAP